MVGQDRVSAGPCAAKGAGGACGICAVGAGGSAATMDCRARLACDGRAVHAQLQQTHPQAAFNACRKELAELATNMECVQACMDTWVAAYKKHQASQ